MDARHLAIVIAMQQTCVIVVLHTLPDFNQKPTENTAKALKYNFLSNKLSNVITSSQRVCNVFVNKNVEAMLSRVMSDKQITARFMYY